MDITALKTNLEKDLSGKDFYPVLESRSVRIQNRVGPIIKAINFQGESHAKDLKEAISHFKEKDGMIEKTAPVAFLKPAELEAVTENGQVSRISLYKVFLFIHSQSGIKSGALNLKHAYKYRPLDDYLIDRDRWDQNRDSLLDRAGLMGVIEPQKVLKELDDALYRQYVTTNQNIKDGSNTLVSFSPKGAFRLKTPRQEEIEAEPIQNGDHGVQVIPPAWLDALELRDVITQLAEDLYAFPSWDIGPYSGNEALAEFIWDKYPGF